MTRNRTSRSSNRSRRRSQPGCVSGLVAIFVISLAVTYWYVTLPLAAVVIAWALVQRADASRRSALVAATVASLPPTPGRVAGPVRWRLGTLELTDEQVVITWVETSGPLLRPVAVRHVAVLPRANILRVDKTTGADGQTLTVSAKGGGVHAYPGCRDGDAIVQFLEVLAADVPVVENGIRWPRSRPARRLQVVPHPVRCPMCGAPLERGAGRCSYCHSGLGGTAL